MSLKVFAAQALADFHTTASVAPSSQQLVSAMVEHVPKVPAPVVVEFGAGTGAMTKALLEQLPADGRLFIFEINPRFVTYLRAKFPDPRMSLINASVENVDSELRSRGVQRVDAVVSSLGLSFMSPALRTAIFEHLMPFVHEKTVLTQYQYLVAMQVSEGRLRRMDVRPLLSRYFGSIKSRIVWFNLPPAYVFTCQLRPSPEQA
ncbi:MAG TPA: methyltransferase domain-containing protein [Candidatus Acidoferrales bacterium]|nr:methyltransferase domain-containing protein [Candidatus Acidoferrales bacterium]